MSNQYYLFILIIICFSCNKDLEQPDITLPIEPRTFELPVVNDGILVFNSNAHLDDYYRYLYDLAINSDNPDSVLHIEEQKLTDFTSIRQASHVDSILDSEFIEKINSDFVGDIIMKSILNVNYEYAVGTSVFVYFNENQFYEIRYWNEPTINSFRMYPKGAGLPPVQCYSPEVISALSNDNIAIACTTFNYPAIIPRSLAVRIATDTRPFEACENHTKRVIAMLQFFDGTNWIPLEGDWSYQFGDGSGWVHLNASTLDITHFYQSVGTYTITITASYIDPVLGLQDRTASVIVIVSDRTCKLEEHTEKRVKTVGNWRLVSRLWFKESLGLRQGSESEAWNKKNNTWHKKRAQLDVWCGAKWFDYTEFLTCEFDEFEEDSDHGAHSRQELVHLRGYFQYYKDEFDQDQPKSTHRLEVPGIIITEYIALNECD